MSMREISPFLAGRLIRSAPLRKRKRKREKKKKKEEEEERGRKRGAGKQRVIGRRFGDRMRIFAPSKLLPIR
jgi:hypothetical protein